MGDINISGRMARKSVTRDMSGNIINMVDEERGGYIIRNRQVVNQERFNELQKMEQDKREAAKAAAAQRIDPNLPDRNVAPSQARQEMSKVENLEKRIDAQDSKLDAILAALKK